MWRWISISFLALLSTTTLAQELFPMTEQASTVSKGAIVPRVLADWYRERTIIRSMGSVGFYYGITRNVMLRVSGTMSNHHGHYLPLDMLGHRHVGSQTYYYSQTAARGKLYPFVFSGFNFYSQYRFFSKDGNRKHFRLAGYLEYSTARSPHDEAEPDLMDDNAGTGLGFIATRLKNRLALSLSTGYIIPESYEEVHGGVYRKIDYSAAQKFSFSLGYLAWPKEYVSYHQTNTNLYLEILGKNVHSLTFVQDGEIIPLESPAHKSSFYLEIFPGIQRIYNSTTRVDFTIGFALANRSYAHLAPMYRLSIRHYLFS